MKPEAERSPPDDGPEESEADRAAFEFMLRLEEDRAQGRTYGLDHYLLQFPRFRERLSAEWETLREAGPSDSPEEDLAPIQKLGPYEVIEEIGRGGQGIVFRARDSRLGREVAIKVLTLAAINAGAMLARFQREAAAASKLDHPGLCGVLDAGVSSGSAWIAFRFVPGQSLSALLREARSAGASRTASSWITRQPTDPASGQGSEEAPAESGDEPSSFSRTRKEVIEVVRIFAAVAEALQVAHDAGVVHRDLKPGNIMVTPSGQPVIVDFGLASVEDEDHPALTQSGDLFGTPAYMSPEQLEVHASTLDGRTDVWSLGVSLYECLTLNRPFEGPSRQSVYQAIQTRDPQSLRRHNPAISRDLEVVVRTALEKDRDRRYRSARALALDLRNILDRQPIHARPAGLGLRLRRWAQRHPLVAASLAITIVGLSTGLGTSLTALQNEREARDAQEVALEAERLRTYCHGISLANAAIASGNLAAARGHLLGTDPSARKFEWFHLWHRARSSVWRHSAFGIRDRGLFFVDSDRFLLGRFATEDPAAPGFRLFDSATGKLLRSFGRGTFGAATAWLDGNRTALFPFRGALEQWDVLTGQRILSRKIQGKIKKWTLIPHPNGRHVMAIHNNTVRTIDIRDLSVTPPTELPHGGVWEGIDPDQHVILGGKYGVIIACHPERPQLLGYLRKVHAWTPWPERGEFLKVKGGGAVAGISMRDLSEQWRLTLPTAASYQPGRTPHELLGIGRTSLVLFQIPTGRQLAALPFDEIDASSVTWTADGNRFAIKHGQGEVAFYPPPLSTRHHIMGADRVAPDRRTAVQFDWGALRILDFESGQHLRRIPTQSYFIVHLGVYFEDSRRMLIGTTPNGNTTELEVIDLESGETLSYARCQRTLSKMDHHEGWSAIGDAEGLITIHEGESLTPSSTWTVGAKVTALEFSPDGKQLIAGTAAGTILIRDLETGIIRAEVRAHDGPVTDIRSRGTVGLISAGEDGWIRIHDQFGANKTWEFNLETPITCLALHPSGERLVAGSRKWLRILHLPTGAAVLTHEPDLSRRFSIANAKGWAEQCDWIDGGDRLVIKRFAFGIESNDLEILSAAPTSPALQQRRALVHSALALVRTARTRTGSQRGAAFDRFFRDRLRAAIRDDQLASPEVKALALEQSHAEDITACHLLNMAHKYIHPIGVGVKELEIAIDLTKEAIRSDPRRARHHAYLVRAHTMAAQMELRDQREVEAWSHLHRAAVALDVAGQSRINYPDEIEGDRTRAVEAADAMAAALPGMIRAAPEEWMRRWTEAHPSYRALLLAALRRAGEDQLVTDLELASAGR